MLIIIKFFFVIYFFIFSIESIVMYKICLLATFNFGCLNRDTQSFRLHLYDLLQFQRMMDEDYLVGNESKFWQIYMVFLLFFFENTEEIFLLHVGQQVFGSTIKIYKLKKKVRQMMIKSMVTINCFISLLYMVGCYCKISIEIGL